MQQSIESRIISSLLISPILWEKIEGIVKPDHFVDLRDAFDIIYNKLISGDEINIPLFLNEIKRKNISWAPETKVDKRWIVDYAQTLQDNHTKRALDQFIFDVSSMSDDKNEERLTFIKSQVELIETFGFETADPRQITLERTLEYLSSTDHLIKTPWSDFNEYHGGWLRKSVTTIGALPGTGKTTILRQASLIPAKAGIPVAIFTLETTKEMLNVYFACTELKIPAYKVYKGTLTEHEIEQIKIKLVDIKNLPIYIYDVTDFGSDAEKIDLLMRRVVRKYGVQLIFIDYLQIMTLKNQDENGMILKVFPMLKRTSMMTNTSIVIFSQFTKEILKRTIPKPKADDFRGSAAIFDASDLIFGNWRPERHEITHDKDGEPTDGKMYWVPFKSKYLNGKEELIHQYDPNAGTYHPASESGQTVMFEDKEDDNFWKELL